MLTQRTAGPELRDSIMQVDFPQYHLHRNVLYPRVSSILRLHVRSLFQRLLHDTNFYFHREVERRSVEGTRIHNAARTSIHQAMREDRIAYTCDLPEETEKDAGTVEMLMEWEHAKLERCMRWLLSNNITILRPPEQTIVSPALGYGGSPDLICKSGHHTFVIDLKTGRHIYEPNWLQVQSYADLAEREYGIHADRMGILLLETNNKDARFECKNTSQMLRNEFTHLTQDWYRMFPDPFQAIAA